MRENLAFAAELFQPAGEDSVGGGFDIEEFEAHADAWFDDADHGKRLDGFAFACERDTSAGFYSQGFACADEAAAQGDVRGDAV